MNELLCVISNSKWLIACVRCADGGSENREFLDEMIYIDGSHQIHMKTIKNSK